MDKKSFACFMIQVIKAILKNKIWVFTIRGVVVDCSSKALDFAEIAWDELIGSDILTDPIMPGIKIKDVKKGNTDPYFLSFKTLVTKVQKRVAIIPYQCGPWRFSVIEPLKDAVEAEYESKVYSSEAYPRIRPIPPPSEKT